MSKLFLFLFVAVSLTGCVYEEEFNICERSCRTLSLCGELEGSYARCVNTCDTKGSQLACYDQALTCHQLKSCDPDYAAGFQTSGQSDPPDKFDGVSCNDSRHCGGGICSKPDEGVCLVESIGASCSEQVPCIDSTCIGASDTNSGVCTAACQSHADCPIEWNCSASSEGGYWCIPD